MSGRALAGGQRVVLASHNAGKLAEFAQLLAPFDIEMVSAAALGLAEPAEDAPDFAGNALIKARAAAQASGLAALADDSGFAVAALGGRPGVHSARWAGPQKDFAAAMARIADELGQSTDRRAAFHCVLALAWPDGESLIFAGQVQGQFVYPPRGTAGFGYDPVFVPEGKSRSFAEMTAAEKHAISHRARAVAALLASGCLPG